MVKVMDSSMAEAFPDLYRTILDGIARLEHRGRRAEADRIRRTAAEVYSGPWSEAGHRRLALVAAKLERALGAPDSIPSGSGRRRARRAGTLAVLLREATSR